MEFNAVMYLSLIFLSTCKSKSSLEIVPPREVSVSQDKIESSNKNLDLDKEGFNKLIRAIDNEVESGKQVPLYAAVFQMDPLYPSLGLTNAKAIR
ncbi:MAG: hypothetical protein HRU09_20160 [Oligoflexales bacterium]|nr:hypothetical protein [Oligoflexales bacterium]